MKQGMEEIAKWEPGAAAGCEFCEALRVVEIVVHDTCDVLDHHSFQPDEPCDHGMTIRDAIRLHLSKFYAHRKSDGTPFHHTCPASQVTDSPHAPAEVTE